MTSMKWTGQTLGGNYQLVEQLATDDFAATYRAYDNNIRDEVAVKIIHPTLTQSASFPGHFANTARTIAQLRHPNLNRLLDYSHDQGVYFLITEWVPGTTLQARLEALRERRSVMSIDEIVRRATDLTEALSYAHANGQLHQTIKPGSILLAANNRTVLLDLGLSAIAGGSRQLAQHSSLLTAAYLAPEQLRGEIADARTDLFALGVNLYEMVTGQIPFGSDITQTLARQTGRPLPDIRQRRPNTPAALAALVTRLLQPDRTARVQTAAELGQLLSSVQAAPDDATIVEQPAHDATMIQDDGATMILADEGAASRQPDEQATQLQADSGATMLQDDSATIVDPAARHDPTMVQPTSDPGRTVVEDYQATTIEPAGPAGHPHDPTVVENAVPTELLGGSVPPTTIDPPTWSHEPVPGRGPTPGTVISPSPEAPPATTRSRSRTPLLIGCAALLLLAICAGSLYAIFATPLGDSILGRETATPAELVAATTTPTATAAGAEADETAAPTEAAEATEEVAPTEAIAPTEAAEDPTATTEAPTATTEAPTATTAPPTATLEPTPTTAPPTATTVPPTPTQAGPSVQITAIRLDGNTYIVDYTTVGYTESLPGMHIHFFFNTVPPEQAGAPGSGPWYLWGGPRPFNGYTTADRPSAATQMCALVANADHSVIQGTGNCVNLP